jgi:hypothetical protein
MTFTKKLSFHTLAAFDVACYHYFRIFNRWEGAYVLQNGFYKPSNVLFNDAYRYVDWLLTVSPLMVELIAV